MVAVPVPTTCPTPLEHADAALQVALAALEAALDGYRRAGRADLAGTLRPSAAAARRTERLRNGPPAELPDWDPADRFPD
jgi:hypothetical protein